MEYDYIFEERENAAAPALAPSLVQAVMWGAVGLLIAVTSFLLGVMYERRASAAGAEDVATLLQVWGLIEDHYYGDLPTAEEREYGAVQGLVASLNDPFTTFSPPQQAETRRQQIEGQFGGIGVTIEELPDGRIGVQTVMFGQVAEQAGILADDIFLEVDGVSVQGWSTEMLVQAVRGPVGTPVTLKMLRPSTNAEYTVTINRAIIETPTVFAENIEGVGYIRLATFNGVASSQMRTQLEALQAQGVSAIIFDLRGNGGGLLGEAVTIADFFLDAGVILTQKDSGGREETFRSEEGQLIGSEIPVLILVDASTASASEVVAGALQDRDRALIMGQQTFGKGVVQQVYNLPDGSQLRVTAAAWYTPNGTAIHRQGLTPDLLVQQPLGPNGEDFLLVQALEYFGVKAPLPIPQERNR